MNFHLEEHKVENGGFVGLNGTCGRDESMDGFEGIAEDQFSTKSMDLIKLTTLENAPTQSLFSIANRILEESFERKNGELFHRMARLLRKVLQIIERRMSVQAESLRDQNNVHKSREQKFQSRIKVLETLVKGTSEEIQVAVKNSESIKIEKTEVEERRRLEEMDTIKLKKEKDDIRVEVSTLKRDIEMARKTYEKQRLQLEAEAGKTKLELEKKVEELECLLEDSRKKVAELEEFSADKYQRWKRKEHKYRSFIEFQVDALQDLRAASKFMKNEVLKTRRRHSEELNGLGVKLKGLADAARNYHMVLTENRKLYNEIQELKGNIRVYCRIRPFLPGQSMKHTTIEYIGENGELVVANPMKHGKDSHRLFKFNKVFGPTATQEEVFMDTQPLIRSVLDGFNVCIFAYGQTGSGKTYTMSGPSASSREDWGVNFRALNDLFQIAQSRGTTVLYEVAVQMVEIYNEQVRDLLSSDGPQKRLGIWNTAQPNGLAVPDASMHAVKSTSDVLELMSIGLTNRAVGATALNERSSRSHSVLTVHVRGTDLETDAVLRGSLHLVDLAGSERVDRSEATGDRLKEAQHINKSLSALGDVIFALAQKSPHVPYRNSKLTQVLQSSLGGQAKTLMFVQLNPDVDSYSETVSTLKFAERVSGVELGAARSNKEGREVRELMEQVGFLKEVISKKDGEIQRLQSLKANVSAEKRSLTSLRSGSSSSPRRHSIGTPQHLRKTSSGKLSGLSDKAASDGDNCSEYSDRHSEAGSQQSVDDFKHHKEFYQPSKLADGPVNQSATDDVQLLGLEDADLEERLSDISDGDLSMGTETDGSIGSVVEYTLFPEPSKQPEKSENIEKSTVPSKLPKPPQKLVQSKPSRLTRSATKLSSTSRKSISTTGGSSSAKPLKKWQ
ncbi:kinesin-like protein KIN-14J isoform X2 [Rhodamnia argentea]|uniref:Kinesin-like protein n=1 Tax=Rhodamnia argentea TaxID=178133 RepID=A0A8B8QZC8_9MYRT|nr:kinesin-like protein KIN-14J isoform X2 [Rhodamnia argentea]